MLLCRTFMFIFNEIYSIAVVNINSPDMHSRTESTCRLDRSTTYKTTRANQLLIPNYPYIYIIWIWLEKVDRKKFLACRIFSLPCIGECVLYLSGQTTSHDSRFAARTDIYLFFFFAPLRTEWMNNSAARLEYVGRSMKNGALHERCRLTDRTFRLSDKSYFCGSPLACIFI